MYVRSNSLLLSIPTKSYQGPLAYRPMPRSKEPEIFTFERIPVQEPERSLPLRPRKRNTRVQYPANVRKYLPPAEKSPAKRWLVALCLVLFLQIYTEEASVETTTSSESLSGEVPEEVSFTQYQVLPFQSAEEQARHLRDGVYDELPHVDCQNQLIDEQSDITSRQQVNQTCPGWEAEMNRMHQQSSSNGYVVALLYPAVYHRLGCED
ncbi:radiation-inducible immediate-early gene IEX-1 [Esox lucius]|uniref:Radiation-inducible immediate-early gene IEX-1 n=1 Tax=Esox lucius TaxID=8010 RepID=A0AAY5KNW5_ESOLU|nr:radiation-inducible immediate-early gene IEX-1 [Esox lucius]